MVDHLEPLRPCRVVGAADVHHALVLRVGVVPQEGVHRHDAGRRNVEGELILVDRGLLNELGQGCEEVRSKGLEGGGDVGVVQRGVASGGLTKRSAGSGSCLSIERGCARAVCRVDGVAAKGRGLVADADRRKRTASGEERGATVSCCVCALASQFHPARTSEMCGRWLCLPAAGGA